RLLFEISKSPGRLSQGLVERGQLGGGVQQLHGGENVSFDPLLQCCTLLQAVSFPSGAKARWRYSPCGGGEMVVPTPTPVPTCGPITEWPTPSPKLMRGLCLRIQSADLPALDSTIASGRPNSATA